MEPTEIESSKIIKGGIIGGIIIMLIFAFMMSWTDNLIRECPQGLAQKRASFCHIYVGLYPDIGKGYGVMLYLKM